MFPVLDPPRDSVLPLPSQPKELVPTERTYYKRVDNDDIYALHGHVAVHGIGNLWTFRRAYLWDKDHYVSVSWAKDGQDGQDEYIATLDTVPLFGFKAVTELTNK